MAPPFFPMTVNSQKRRFCLELQEIIQNVVDGEIPHLTLDDTFQFQCNQCGKCCINDEIMVSVWDIVRIANALKMPSIEVCNNFIKFHIGENTHFPIATLRMVHMHNPVTEDDFSFCPFLRFSDGGDKASCLIQSDKPFICAVYPLGRGTFIDQKTGEIDQFYFVQPITCGKTNGVPVKIRDWLNQYDLEGSDQATLDFTNFLSDLRGIVNLDMMSLNPDYDEETSDATKELLAILMDELYGSYVPEDEPTNSVDSAHQIFSNVLELVSAFVKDYPQFAPVSLKSESLLSSQS